MDVFEAFHVGSVGGDWCHHALHNAYNLVLGASIQSRIWWPMEESDWHHILVHILLSVLRSQ